MTRLDLGSVSEAAWWSGFFDSGRPFADRQPPEAASIQADFAGGDVFTRLLDAIADEAVGLVISDMPPNMSAVESVDLPRAIQVGARVS